MAEFELTELQYAKPVKGDLMKLHLFDDDGFHRCAIWFTSGAIHHPDEVVPLEVAWRAARLHIKIGREVRVTDGGDMLLFHSQHGGILYPKDCNLEEFWSML